MIVQIQYNDVAAGLVFAQKAAGDAAHHQNRDFFLEGLHVDAGTVAGIALDEDLAAPHGVAGGVSRIAVNIDGAFVHGISGGFLGIAVDMDGAAVQIGAQGVAGSAVDDNGFAGKPRTDVALANAVFDYNIGVWGGTNGFI